MIEQMTLKRCSDGETRSLEGWGIVTDTAVLTLSLLGAAGAADDSFTCQLKLDVDETNPFPRNTKCEIFNGDGTRVFVGWARSPGAPATPQSERQTLTLESPTRFLQSVFLQVANVLVDGEYTQYLTSSAILNQAVDVAEDGTASSNKLTVAETVDEILTYAQAYGNAGTAAPFDYSLTGIPLTSDFDAETTGIETAAANTSCIACVEKALKYLPEVAMLWDYSGTTGTNPVLRFLRSQTIDFTTGALLATPTLVGGVSPVIHTIPMDGTIIMALTPRARDDLLCGQMQIIYIHEVEEESDTVTTTTQSSTVDNGSPIMETMTVDLRESMWDPAQNAFVDSEQPPGYNLARCLHQGPRSRLAWELGLSTGPSENLRWTWKPGDLVNVTGALADLATAHSQVQVVTRNFGNGETTLTTGTPSQRGLHTRSSYRNTTASEPSTEQNTYGTPKDAGGKGKDPDEEDSQHPWFVSTVPGGVGSLSGTVRPGFIDTIAPDYESDPIDGTPAPVIPISTSGTQHVILKLKLTLSAANGYVYAAEYDYSEVIVAGSVPADNKATGLYYRRLATFVGGVKQTPQPERVNLGWQIQDTALGTSTADCTFIGQ